jgi:flagellar protein FliS
MALPNPYRQYQAAQVQTAGPAQLTLMCYDGALRFLKQARAAMEARDLEAQSKHIGKTQALLSELIKGLDFQQGGEIARNLDGVYRYLYDRLSHATIKDDLAALDEVRDHLAELREAWSQALRLAAAPPSAAAAVGADGPRAALALAV